VIEAEHTCMSVRGVAKHGAMTSPAVYTGMFRDNPAEQARFLSWCEGCADPRFDLSEGCPCHFY